MIERLSIDQWNLLSNLTHCYDEYNGFLLARRFIQEQNDLRPKMRFKLASDNEFFYVNHRVNFYTKKMSTSSLYVHMIVLFYFIIP
jgi:hypothetical protein